MRLWKGIVLCAILITPIVFAVEKKNTHTNQVSKKVADTQSSLKGDPLAGKWKSENERCQECHGSDGHGHGHIDGTGKIVKFAKLAGQYPEYLWKQIRDFRSGARKDDFMQMMAKSVDDQDMADILAYFSSQSKMVGEVPGESEIAKALFFKGDVQRGVIACASCHGTNGRGINDGKVLVPSIAGQEWRYLQKQLLDWRSGQRKNAPDGVMNSIMKPLTDSEVDALANYLSGLK